MQGWSLFSSLDIWGTIEPFRPIIDDVEYTKQPMDSFRDGDWHTDKGLVIGTNTQELEMIQYYIPFIDISRLMYKVIIINKIKAYSNQAYCIVVSYRNFTQFFLARKRGRAHSRCTNATS